MPKIVDRDAKCEELTRAAIEAIAERGLESVKLSDIARLAGVTTGTVGYYFRDKEDLLIATLRTLALDMFSRFREMGTISSDSLVDYLPLSKNRMKQWTVWLAYAGAAAASPTLGKAYREFYAEVESSYAEMLPDPDPVSAHHTAGNIIAALDGIGLCAVLQPTVWTPKRQKEAYCDVVEPLIHASTD